MTPAALMLVALAGVATAAGAPDVATFLGDLTLQDVGQTIGLGALATLFATDRILTKGQHERRVADIVVGHERLMLERTERLSEVTKSRDYYREARQTEANRADELARQLAELAVEASRSASDTMTALEEAAREVSTRDA